MRCVHNSPLAAAMQSLRTVRVVSNISSFRLSIRSSLYSTMKALVYRSVGNVGLEERPKPQVSQPTDAIVKLSKSTICGTDLHIIKGDVATCTPGTILGHEGIGIIEEVGPSVRGLREGDHVLISCICSCASCEYCRKGMYSHCTTGGKSEAPIAELPNCWQDGSLEIQLMEHRLSMFESLMLLLPFTQCPKEQTKMRLSYSAISSQQVLNVEF